MAAVDFTQPPIVAAMIAAGATLIVGIVAGVVNLRKKRERGAGSGLVQKVSASKDVQQYQAKGNISINTPPPAKPKK